MRKWTVLAGILFLAGGLLMAADAPKTGILKIATPGLVIRVAAPVTVKGGGLFGRRRLQPARQLLHGVVVCVLGPG
jgi:hypothetical protein